MADPDDPRHPAPPPYPEAPVASQAAAIQFHIPNNLLPLNIHLDRHNYSYWRSLILPSVRAHGLDGILLGTTPRPEPLLVCTNSINPAFDHWIRCDALLMSWLMNSLSEAMLGHVLHC
ncbi:hypothetical protein CsatB_001409 [Cannabis sativa]|uniref:uncharacterized protein LOC133039732 n=1 Tax=Cannabis sativa TaxID=3483 RepID=UPI0029CA70B2|nr:uncharacterized protein LOC133039732 [Cannabis sativa]